ncbi:hypothetical protein AAFF27_14220 [Xylophilus sp. GW821-FHT01B05]
MKKVPVAQYLPGLVAISLVASIAFISLPAGAHEGHAEAPASPASPPGRLSAQSAQFEIAGALAHDTLTLYLDRYASNEPVTGARIEVEAGAASGLAEPQADGSYRFQHDALETAGTVPVHFAIEAAGVAELLSTELAIAADGAEPDHGHAEIPWRTVLAAAALLAVLAFFLLRARRRRAANPSSV